jgi:hypothetical protein
MYVIKTRGTKGTLIPGGQTIYVHPFSEGYRYGSPMEADPCMYVCMYVCMYKGRAIHGPCTATHSGLLCFPFNLSPQQSRTSDELQDLVRGGRRNSHLVP